MKKQRILALTLAASTAASVFGGFSASAADPYYEEAFGGSKGTDIYQLASAPAIADVVSKINDGSKTWSFDAAVKDGAFSDDVTFSNDVYYGFDYEVIPDSENSDAATDLDKLIGAIEDKEVSDAKFKAYYKESTGNFTFDLNSTYGQMTETRKIAVDEFDKVLKDSAKFALDGSTFAPTNKTFYSAEDLKNLNISGTSGLIAKMNGIKGSVSSTATSVLLYYVSEYHRLDNLVAPTSSWEEKYAELLEKVDGLVESDYTSDNWKKVQDYIDEADYWAGRENWEKACELLNSALTVTTKTVNAKALNAAVEALYTDGASNTKLTTAVTAYLRDKKIMSIEAYTGSSDDKAAYTYALYGDDKYAWIDFAGDADTAGAYRNAVAVYALCSQYSTRKTVAQSTVDAALENLQDALRALNPDAATENWLVVKLEALLEKANAVNADDYRTTALTWGKFEKAIEAAEKLLEKEYFTEDEMTPVYNELQKQLNALSGIAKAVPSDTKNELKALIKEADKALDKKDGKTADQIIALEDALEAANKVSKTGKLISAFETAIADLESALAGYNQKQGWYFENNAWFYGKGATTVKGWLNDNGTWYYFDTTTGTMKTGWQKIDNTWYLFKTGAGAGKMLTGWQKVGNTWYYLNGNGSMATGWAKINNVWYYFQPSGAMVSNTWAWIGDKCYYFYASGAMAANTTVGGYRVDASGAWVK